MAAGSSRVKNFLNAVVRLSDGTGTPVTLIIPLDQGNYSLTGLMAKLNEAIKVQARGKFKTLVRGPRTFPGWSLSAFVGNLIGSSDTAPGTPLEFVFGLGAYDANVSTLGANQEITVDVRITIEGTEWGDTADETIDLEDVVVAIDFNEAGEGNTMQFTGEVLGAVVITNSTNTVTLAQAA